MTNQLITIIINEMSIPGKIIKKNKDKFIIALGRLGMFNYSFKDEKKKYLGVMIYMILKLIILLMI